MKKTSVLFIAMLFSVVSFGQANPAKSKKTYIDIKPAFGFNASHLTTEHVDWKTQGRVGYQFGAGVLVGDKLYFEPGIYWTTVSKDIINKNDPNNEAFKNTINGIRIPVYIGYHILGSEETFADLRLFAGPAASFVTSVKNDHEDISKDDFKNMMFDLDVGAGVDVWFLFLEWHYVFGLTPVFNEGSDAKLQAFMGNLGIRIKF